MLSKSLLPAAALVMDLVLDRGNQTVLGSCTGLLFT
jgi:hypothetical protein